MKMENNASGTRGCCSRMKTCWHYIVRNAVTASCLAALVLGIVLALILKFYMPVSQHDQLYVIFPAELLQRMLQVVTIPLIVTIVITGVIDLRVESSGNVGVHAAAYFFATTLLSLTLGLGLVLLLKPGVAVGKEDKNEEFVSIVNAFLDLVQNLAPRNMIKACFLQQRFEKIHFEIEADEPRFSQSTTEVQLVKHFVEGTDTLGMIVWSFVFGLNLIQTGEQRGTFVETLTVLNEATQHVVHMILGYLPFGLLFMVISHVFEVDDWETTFKLGKFMGIVVLGLVIHGLLVLPLIYVLFARSNSYAVIKVCFPALRTALVTSSSSATRPFTIQCCEKRLKVDKSIRSFMMPTGNNIHLVGTVLYEVIAAVFITQLNHVHLDVYQLIGLIVTSALASTGATGLPARGAVTTLFVLTAVGLPANETCILVVIEWVLDHLNTVINVMGNCIGMALIQQLSKREQEMERMHGSDAEAQTPDEIQVHICSQASDDDTPPKEPSFINSDAEEPFQDEDQTQLKCTM